LPRLGIAGAALAYGAAFLVASLILGAMVWHGGLRPGRAHWALEWRTFREILRVGAVSSVQALQTVLTAIALTGFVGSFGTAALAGYGVGMRLELLQIPLVFAIGQALVVMVGTNIGAGRGAHAKRITWTGTAIAAGISLAIGATVAVFPAVWVRIFSDDPAVLAAGALYLRVVAPFYALFGAGMALYFASQGAGRLAWPLTAGFARLTAAAAGGWVAGYGFGWELPGIFAAIALALVIFGTTTAAAVRLGAWR
jgi:Na+-driven multidrug efflux pump